MARLTPITSKDQVAPEAHGIVDVIVKSRGGLHGPFSMFLHAPELAERVAHLGAYVRFEGGPAEDAQIIDFTRRLMREHRVDDETAAAIMQRFGDRGLIELTGSIGYYALPAMTVNVCELEAAPGAEVLKGASA